MKNENKESEYSPRSLIKRIPLVIFDAVVLKVAIVVCMLIGGGLGLLHWGQKKENKDAFVAGNLGFKQESTMLGLSSNLKTFESINGIEPPYSYLIPGEHKLDFSLKATIAKGGILGIGQTQNTWIAKGYVSGKFGIDSLYALLENGNNQFLEKAILPILRNPIESQLGTVDSNDDSLDVDAFSEKVNATILEKLSGEFDLTQPVFVLTDIHPMSDAEKKRDNLDELDKITCTTLLRHVEGEPQSWLSWLSWLGFVPIRWVLILGGVLFALLIVRSMLG